ncbi:hypothetical protein MANES_12G151000v8 [Manihot esculenta]|uniref:Transmembrane protein n=1 Tax=Manihot esculenta TaxID=3983 RepID=A0A2C9UWV3_MANES|nr:hypothetical protein MANES_12G151000v8 [Manihot esculenta]
MRPSMSLFITSFLVLMVFSGAFARHHKSPPPEPSPNNLPFSKSPSLHKKYLPPPHHHDESPPSVPDQIYHIPPFPLT